ncbi:MAG: cytochrome c3 family protein [Longimicrobiales bacterium]
MKKNWLIGGLAGVLALAGVAFVQGGGAEGEAEGGGVQPIAFPHNLHAGSEEGQANMNCQFCHFSAERSVDAGIPPVSTCWGCHQVIPGRNAPEEVLKIEEHMESGEPIPWVRIYKISDHAHFPHMRHIAAGLQCQQCHGEVQTMGVLTERDPVWGGANMGWCIDCHRQPNEQGVQQASTDCAVCHY